MKIETFEMEREQSTWEQRVRCNLSESGVHPMRLDELISEDLGGQRLGYPQTNGSEALRGLITTLYPGAGAEEVTVTNGTSEANFLSIWNLVEPGDEVVLMFPNYMQIWGLARSQGARVRPWMLRRQGDRWSPDLAELEELVGERTRLIAVCHPNNPTGAVLNEGEMDAVCRQAERVGAWVLADEVYRGAELKGETAPTFYGRYDRLLVTSGLSKAFGLPGLRIGWTVGPPQKVAQLWARKDYTTIGPGIISERLARSALEPENRERIWERTRGIVRRQLPLLEEWLGRHGGLFDLVPPRAGAIAWIGYSLDVNSTELCRRLRDEKSVLIVPGDHFHMDGFLRIGYGCEPDALRQGLELFSELLDEL